MRAAQAQAASEGYAGVRARMRAAEILRRNWTPAMRSRALDYALRNTLLNDPYGALGGRTR